MKVRKTQKIKSKIVNDVLKLNRGELFEFEFYFGKYGVDEKDYLSLTLEILEELGDSVEANIPKKRGNLVPVIGLPYNITYTKK